MVVDKRSFTGGWQNKVFWYEARKIPSDFKFGAKFYWQFHYRHYCRNYTTRSYMARKNERTRHGRKKRGGGDDDEIEVRLVSREHKRTSRSRREPTRPRVPDREPPEDRRSLPEPPETESYRDRFQAYRNKMHEIKKSRHGNIPFNEKVYEI